MAPVALTTAETMTAVERAHREHHYVIGEDAARMIASWYHSPADVDTPITALSHGLDFDAVALVTRVGQLIESAEFAGTAALPELEALRDWALKVHNVHAIEITEWEIDADTWEQWQEDGTPDPRPTGSRELFVVAQSTDDQGDWVYPGDAAYPSDRTGFLVDTNDGGVWLPGTLVKTAGAMLAGWATSFWAGSRGGDPFDWGLYWGTTDPSERGDTFASQYIDPYSGEVEIKIAKVYGFTPEEIDGMTGWKRDRTMPHE